jgi:hypothetical protein
LKGSGRNSRSGSNRWERNREATDPTRRTNKLEPAEFLTFKKSHKATNLRKAGRLERVKPISTRLSPEARS